MYKTAKELGITTGERRRIANTLLIGYKMRRWSGTRLYGAPAGATLTQWRAYRHWVLEWLRYCNLVKDGECEHGQREEGANGAST